MDNELKEIQNLYEQVDDAFKQKGWLKKKVEESRPVLNAMSSVLKIVSIVLAYFGIEIGAMFLFAQEAVSRLLPGDNESYSS